MNYEELNINYINEFIDTCIKVQNRFNLQIIDLKNKYIEPYLDNFQIYFFENKIIDNDLCIFLFLTFTLYFLSYIFYLLHNSILLYNNKKQIIKNKYVKISLFETTISLFIYVIYNILKLYFGSLCIYFIYTYIDTYNDLDNNIFFNDIKKYVKIFFYEKIKPQLLFYINYINNNGIYIYTLHNNLFSKFISLHSNFIYDISQNIENYRNVCKEMNFEKRLLCKKMILNPIVHSFYELNNVDIFRLGIIDGTIISFLTSSMLYILHNSILHKYDPVSRKYLQISFFQSLKLVTIFYLEYILKFITDCIGFTLNFIMKFHIMIFKQIMYFNYLMLKNIIYFNCLMIKNIIYFTNDISKYIIESAEDLYKR